MHRRPRKILVGGTWRWGVTLFASAVLLSWAASLVLWCGVTIEGHSCTLSHGAIAIERTDTSVGWTAADGNAFPEHVHSVGSFGTISWTWLDDLPGYTFASRFTFLRWRPGVGTTAMLLSRGQRWYLDLPLWIVLIPALAVAALAWRTHALRMQAIRNRACPWCEYDLRGLAADAMCPECGRPSTT